MKRVSLVLSILLMLGLCVIPIAAEDLPTEQTSYRVDFAQLYEDMGLTEPVDAMSEDYRDRMGVTMINSHFAANIVVGQAYNRLTENGLELGNTHGWISGIALTNDQFNLYGKSDYTVSVEMAIDEGLVLGKANLYYGFGYDASKTTVQNPYASSSNFRTLATGGQNVFHSNSHSPASLSDRGIVYGYLVGQNNTTGAETEHNTAIFSYKVADGKLESITISCGDQIVAYNTPGTTIDATAGNFGFNFQNTQNDSGKTVLKYTVKSIAVTASDAEPMRFAGYQRTVAEGDTYGLRFLAALPQVDESVQKVGFRISVELSDGSIKNFKESESTSVYRSVTGEVDGTQETYYAQSLGGEALALVTLINIPASETEMTFTIVPYLVLADGNTQELTSVEFTYSAQ